MRKLLPQEMKLVFKGQNNQLNTTKPNYDRDTKKRFGQITNGSGKNFLVYCPKVLNDLYKEFDNAIYLLPPDCITPDDWDCDGYFVPLGQNYYIRTNDMLLVCDVVFPTDPEVKISLGAAVKIYDMEHIKFDENRNTILSGYRTIFKKGQIKWFIPTWTDEMIQKLKG